MNLLTMDDLAVMMQVSVSHVRQNIVTHKAFPRPIEIPGTGKRPARRWDADEVDSFLRRLKPPASRPGRPPKG